MLEKIKSMPIAVKLSIAFLFGLMLLICVAEPILAVIIIGTLLSLVSVYRVAFYFLEGY